MKKQTKSRIDCQHFIGFSDSDFGKKCNHLYEMIYVVSGNGGIKIEGTFLPFEKHTIYLLKPLTYYEIFADSGAESERYHVSFSSANLGEELRTFLSSLFADNTPCAIHRDFSFSEISRIFNGLNYADKLSGEGREQYLSAMVVQLLVFISSLDKRNVVASSNDLAAEVADYIMDNIKNCNFLSLDEIAKTFFVSKYYLCRIFKSYSGISIHAYINHKRIMIAKQYMDSGMSAMDASKKVGYLDYSAFYRAYVKVVGKSPRSEKGE